MLTDKEIKFLFESFRNSFYINEKTTIEELYKKIEDPKTLEIRNRLLHEAEVNASKKAEIAIKKIAKENFDDLLQKITSGDNAEQFGEELLKDIEEVQKKK